MAVQGESAMTPTGLVLCVVTVSVAIFVPGPYLVPLPPMAFVSCFLLLERRNDALKALGYGLVVMGPIAIYLSVVWILIAGAAPVPQGLPYPRAGHSAVVYVANLCSRLLLFVVLLHAALKSSLTEGALRFLTEVKLPKPVKIMLAMTLAIASTIRASTEKAWVSLVTANLLTPRMSWRNARHGGLLVHGVRETANEVDDRGCAITPQRCFCIAPRESADTAGPTVAWGRCGNNRFIDHGCVAVGEYAAYEQSVQNRRTEFFGTL